MKLRSNREWIEQIQAGGEQQATALEDLRGLFMRWLPRTIEEKLDPSRPEAEALAEEIVQETLIRIVSHLNTYEGRSQFTTWAHKIAVRAVLTELRRARWRDVALFENRQADGDENQVYETSDGKATPEERFIRDEMMNKVNRILMEEMTDKQRQVLEAVMDGVPLEETAHRMNTNRNALYKMLHDARLRLKKRMEKEGLTPQEVLAMFERTPR